jgi:hypothetical protein
MWKSTTTDERHRLHVRAAVVGIEFQVQAGIHKSFEAARSKLSCPPECPFTDARISTARGPDNFVNCHRDLRRVLEHVSQVINQSAPWLWHAGVLDEDKRWLSIESASKQSLCQN